MSRDYFPGMGEAVAARTINRPGESWKEVAHRVALGNSLLDQTINDYPSLSHHLLQASTLMSGRHLQHGDANQPGRPMEVFSNCSTAMLRFLTFKLLLSGSGVGGCYDDDLMVLDLTKMPRVVCVIDPDHKDVVEGRIKGFTSRAELYTGDSEIIYFRVPDSREGWAQAIEQIEILTYLGKTDVILVLDFTDVRPYGAPIRGMQNRPASGPGPLMEAIVLLASLRGQELEPWEAAMMADHFLAACVVVGGARRAARIAIKHWKDRSIFKFIDFKRPVEFLGKSREEVMAMRAQAIVEGDPFRYSSRYWSSNNSVAVDQEFYDCLAAYERATYTFSELTEDMIHAKAVWDKIMDCQYGDGTGETGILNVHKLTVNNEDVEQYLQNAFARSDLYHPDPVSEEIMVELADRVINHSYQYIVNPCGEIVLFILGGFCVIADVVPFHSQNDEDAEDSFRATTRALIRTNLMDSIYGTEVARTNRIGVGLTGLHEYMWDRFQLSFRDAVAHGNVGPMGITEKAAPFWNMLKRFGDAVDDEAERYAKLLGVKVPHTNKTVKPAGTTSKLFGLTEGVHLPPKRKFLRWVQFRNGDPLIEEYRRKGYPVRELKSYQGTTIVGFPTAPTITTMEGLDVVTAPEATPEEQFRWLRLLEHYWLGDKRGNQVSYTLKYDPKKVCFEEYKMLMRNNIETVRAVSVLPSEDVLSYEYQPEEPISDAQYDAYMAQIEKTAEEVDRVHVDCDNGACPIDFNERTT